MNISIGVKALSESLYRLLPLARSKALPIASNFLLSAGNGKLIIISTNTEVWAEQYVEADVKEDGIVCVNAQILYDFISSVMLDELNLVSEGEHLSITAEGIDVTISGTDHTDFPTVDNFESDNAGLFSINPDLLINSIAQVSDVVSDDHARMPLTGIYMHTFDKHLYVVATDGYRLAQQKIMPIDCQVALLVPPSATSTVRKLFSKLDGDITIDSSETLIIFSNKHGKVTSRMIDAKYPPYSKLIPSNYVSRITVSREEVQNVIKSVSTFTNKETHSVVANISQLDQSVTFTANGHSSGSATLLVNGIADGEDESLRLNAVYVLNALSHIKADDVSIDTNGQGGPVIFREDIDGEKSSYLHLVMPLKY